MALKHPVHRRGVHAHDAGDAGRTEASVLAQRHDPALDAGLGLAGKMVRATGPILESGDAFFLVAAPPYIGPVSRDACRCRRMGDRPAPFDAFAECRSRPSDVSGSLRCI